MYKFMRSEPLDSHSFEGVMLQYPDESADALLNPPLSSLKKDELVSQERDVGRSRLIRADTASSLGNMFSVEYSPSRSSSRSVLSDNIKYSNHSGSRSERLERRKMENHRGSSSSNIGNGDDYNRSYKQYDDFDRKDSRRSSRSSLHSTHSSNKPFIAETTSPPQPLPPSVSIRQLSSSSANRDDSETWDSSSLSTHDSHGNITCYRGYTQRKSITSMDPRLPDSDLSRSRRSSREETVESRARRTSRDETEIRMRHSSREELESRQRRTSRNENRSGVSRERRSSSVKEGKIHISHRDLNSGGSHHDQGQGQDHSSQYDTAVPSTSSSNHHRNRYSSEQSSRSRDYMRSRDYNSRSHDHIERSYDNGGRSRDYHRSQSSHEIRTPHRSRRQESLSRESRNRDSIRSHDSTRSRESSRSYYSERSRSRDHHDRERERERHRERDHESDRDRRERDRNRHYKRDHHRHSRPEIKELLEDKTNEVQPPEINRARRKSSFDHLPTLQHEKFKISK